MFLYVCRITVVVLLVNVLVNQAFRVRYVGTNTFATYDIANVAYSIIR